MWGLLKHDPGSSDDTELAKTTKRGEEKLRILRFGANQRFAFPRNDLQLRHVRRLGTVKERLSANAAVRQRSPNR